MTTCQHHQCEAEALAAAEDICAQRGTRFTAPRRRVFEIIWQSHKALTAADIMQKLGNNQPPITYRALDFLKELNLVHHISSLNAYVGCLHAKADDHVGQMLICERCKDVQELVPEQALKSLQHEAMQVNFHPIHTQIEMLGLCKNCHEVAR